MFIGPRPSPAPKVLVGEPYHDGNPYRLAGMWDGSVSTNVGPQEVFRKHYAELGRYLASSLHSSLLTSCSTIESRSKLTKLTVEEYLKLSTDVYDELMRRKQEEEVPVFPARKDLHPKLNHERRRLASLPTFQFQNLCCDIRWLLAQRHPEFTDDPPGRRPAACNHSDYHRPHFGLSSTSPDELYDNYGQRNINAAKGSGIVPLVGNSELAELELGVQGKATQILAPLASIAPVDLTRNIARDNLYPAHGGSYADIFCGTLSKNGRAIKVAIKVIRSHTYTEANQLEIDKRLRREIRMWCGLQHSNIVQLLGTTTDFGPYTAMVCPWMKEGNLNHYLDHRKPELNLQRRLEILKDVVEGLFYLHAHSIIHGDLTTGNILMDGRTACLTDFGLSNVLAEFRTNSLTSSNVACAPRWAAPELYSVGTTVPEVTTHCDIYSFGSIALQVISGRLPYGEIKSDFVVIIELTKGRNPRRPVEPLLSDGFWNFIVLCWNQDPRRRPAIDELREKLHVLQDTCGQEALVANIVDADKMKGNP